MSLKFNDAKTDFEGETPKAVITAIFFESAMGTGTDYDTWWDYQARLLKERHDITLPSRDTPGAHEVLLHSLVKIGVLDVGPRVPETPAGKPAPPTGGPA